MTPRLWYIGLTQAAAPLALRERVQPSREQIRALLDRFELLAHGRLVLSTCERFEVYVSCRCIANGRWVGLLADWFGLPRELLARYAVCRSGDAVADHMLRVAAGLDSRVLGEPQVLGQLREAQQVALEAKALDPMLAALSRSAIRAGRRVRAETQINQGRRSIASLAVEEVLANAPGQEAFRIVVVGTGHLARDVLTSLDLHKAHAVCLVGRNAKAGEALAARFGARFAPLNDLLRVIRDSRAMITCTSADAFLVDRSMIESRRSKPLDIVDLCVPRNVDPDVRRRAGVRLLHLDEMLNRRMPAVTGLVPALEIVRQERSQFHSWCRERAAAPLIAALVREARSSSEAPALSVRKDLHEHIMHIKRGCVREEAAA